MVTSKIALELIRRIVERNYNRLMIAVLGDDNVSQTVRDEFPNLQGKSLLELAYYHNYLNEEGKADSPESFAEMKAQQSQPGALPLGSGHKFSVDFLNSNLQQLMNKQMNEVESSIIGAILDNNNNFKSDALKDITREDHIEDILKDQTLNDLFTKIKNKLDGKATSDWKRIINTEVSNAIGQGSTDRVVVANKNADSNEVYVFRINPEDSKTCRYCRKFYIDTDGSPKLYRLSTLLGNGTNYGKKAEEWQPTTGSTHPNCRDSQVIELRPGYVLLPGGKVTFKGLDSWRDYIHNKLSS